MKKLVFILVAISLLHSCNVAVKSSNKLKKAGEIKLNIQEPSGITYYKNHLYIVSDFNGLVYKTDLKGKIVKKIATDFTDLEGVTINDKGDLFVVNENKRTLVKLKPNGETDKKYKIKGEQKNGNSGLEGVCFNSLENNFFVLNESVPKHLLTVSKKGKINNKVKLSFAKDVSGVCLDEKLKCLWIVSDESQKLYKTSLRGEKLADYKIPVAKAEGVTIFKNNIYIVSDAENKLYVFKKPN